MPQNNPNRSEKDYNVEYREVKYPRLEFKTGKLLLILPKNTKEEQRILKKHQKWITQKEAIIKKALEDAKKKTLNLERTNSELKDLVISIVNSYKSKFDAKVNQIFFRRMKTKWASYSNKGNLTINTQLRYLTSELIKYVIFHEMAHSIERKHNDRFWRIIEKEFNDFSKKERELLVNWFSIQKEVNQ